MTKLATLFISLFLSACSVVPVKRTFPAAPDVITEPCPQLVQLKNDAQLSDIISAVIDNYALYHECQLKVDSWNEWYKTQKQIFEE